MAPSTRSLAKRRIGRTAIVAEVKRVLHTVNSCPGLGLGYSWVQPTPPVGRSVMIKRGQCRCGAIIHFRPTPRGYKTRCSVCQSIVRLRVEAATVEPPAVVQPKPESPTPPPVSTIPPLAPHAEAQTKPISSTPPPVSTIPPLALRAEVPPPVAPRPPTVAPLPSEPKAIEEPPQDGIPFWVWTLIGLAIMTAAVAGVVLWEWGT